MKLTSAKSRLLQMLAFAFAAAGAFVFAVPTSFAAGPESKTGSRSMRDVLGTPKQDTKTGSLSMREVLASTDDDANWPKAANGTSRANSAHTGIAPNTKEIERYFFPAERELEQLFEYVRGEKVVRTNPLYTEVLGNTIFKYVESKMVVNAGSFSCYLQKKGNQVDVINFTAETMELAKQHPDAYVGPIGCINVYGGEVRFAKLCGLALAMDPNGSKGKLSKLAELLEPRHIQCLDNVTLILLVERTGLLSAFNDEATLSTAQNIAAGMLMATIAHECGHIALGHTLDPGYSVIGNGISRDQERQADSFMSSVIATSPFAKQILLGRILSMYVLSQSKPYDGTGTHPGHKERLENLVRAHPDLAASIGITL